MTEWSTGLVCALGDHLPKHSSHPPIVLGRGTNVRLFIAGLLSDSYPRTGWLRESIARPESKFTPSRQQ